jgi:hypothetical protein
MEWYEEENHIIMPLKIRKRYSFCLFPPLNDALFPFYFTSGVSKYSSSMADTVHWLCNLTLCGTITFHSIFSLLMSIAKNVHSFSLLLDHKEMNSIPP